MAETSPNQLITAADLKADPPLRLNRLFSQIQQQVAAAQGQTGPVTFQTTVTGTQFMATSSAIPTDDNELLTFGAAKAIFSPNAQLAAIASKQWLGEPVQPLPPSPTSGTYGSTIIEADQYCGGAGLSDICINAAIAAAPAAGAAIHCKAGTWAINSAILMNKPNIVLYGDGAGTILNVNPANSFPAGVIQMTAGNQSIQSLVCNGQITSSTDLDISVLNGPMAGDPAHPTLTNNSMIWISNGASTIYLYDMAVQGCGGYAIFGDARMHNLTNINVQGVLLQNNIAMTFEGTISGTLYTGCGSWTGGALFIGGGDGVNPYGYNSTVYPDTQVTGLSISDCTCQNITGTAIWAGFTYVTTNLHTQISIQKNMISDTGRDGILMADAQNFLVSANYLHRVGYVAGNPKYLPGDDAVALDTAGYCFAGQYVGNTILNVNGEGIDLDGFSDGMVLGNTITISWNTDPLYTADQIANYGYSPGAAQNVTLGINTNATFDPRGGQRILISGNTIKNMGYVAISLFDAQNCLVSGNNIWHAGNTSLGAAATGPPVLIECSGSTSPPWVDPPRYNRYNVITGNTIDYDVAGAQYCIVESDASGTVNGPNFVYNNTCLGSNLGQFLASTGGLAGGSNTSYTFHTNSGTSASPQATLAKTVTQREGTGKICILSGITQASSAVVTTAVNHPFVNGDVVVFQAVQGMFQINGVSGTVSGATTNSFTVNINSSGFGAYTAGGYATVSLTGGQKTYSVNLATGVGTLSGVIADIGMINASVDGLAFTGALTTASRSTFSNLTDYVYTGKVIMDGYAVFGRYGVNTSYFDNEANSLTDDYGLLRYRRTGSVGTGGFFEQSVSTSGGVRVWSSIGGSGSVPGLDTQAIYNKAGSFGADGNLVWTYGTTQQFKVTGITGTAAIASVVGYIQSAEGFYVPDAGLGTPSRSYQAIWTYAGGIWAGASIYANNYIWAGRSDGSPGSGGVAVPITPGDALGDGMMYYDTGSKTFQGRQNGAWVAFATGSTSPGGSTNDIQVNNAGAFAAASSGNFTYNLSTGVLNVGGTSGWVQAAGGFVSFKNAWNAFSGAAYGSGADLAAIAVDPYASTGAYYGVDPLGYGSFPVPLAGLASFGSTTILLWSSTANGTTTAVTSTGLNVNSFINAAAGFRTNNTAYNAIQAPSGGLLAQFLTLNTPAPVGGVFPTIFLSAGSSVVYGRVFGSVVSSDYGTLYLSTNLSYSGSAWVTDSGSVNTAMVALDPGANPPFAVYVSNGGGLGVAALQIYNNGNVGIQGSPSATAGISLTVAGSPGVAGIVLNGGYIQSAQGFYTASTAVTAVNVPSGGAQFGLDVQLRNLYMLGQSGTPASPTSGYGGLTWSGSAGNYKYWNGSAWGTVNFAGVAGVSSVSGSGAGISVSPTTGAVVVSNTGVTSLSPGTAISLSGGTGAVTITNIGVTSVAGTTNQVTVSAATGTVTFSLPQNINTAATPTFSALTLTSSATNALAVTGGIQCSAIAASSSVYNAIQTAGGLSIRTGSANVNDLTSEGAVVIDNNHVFVGHGVNTPSYGHTAAGFNPYVGGVQYTGATGPYTLNWSGGFTIGSTTYHNVEIAGGAVVGIS